MSQHSLIEQLSAERAALVAALTPRTVALAARRRRAICAIRWRGPYLISAAEPLAGADRVDAGGEPGVVIALDLTTDVAVIRTDSASPGEPPAGLAVREGLALGETVAIVGASPHGALLRWGTVCLAGSAWRSRRGGTITQRLEFDTALDARFEGALVADAAGRVAAMQVAGPFGRSLGIPAATIERVLNTVEQIGYLPRPYLGLRVQTLWLDAATVARLGRRAAQVAVVAGIDPGSPAERGGLEVGDLIETIDGEEVEGVDAIARLLPDRAPGSALELGLRRGGASDKRTLTVGERPRAAG
ncbi:MAG TPA: PDZ domain-containing protein [Steroidobacteraceae bacterium]|nr:PDZ domain-containing protein [Steroidobacteraceae bacterium]